MTICKNCDTHFDGKFCSNCGQKGDIHRLTLPHLWHEIFHALTHTDKGILLLIKDLITKPGIVAKEYLEGKRKKYFSPFTFIVLTTALSALAAYKSGYYATLSRPRGTKEFFPHFNETMQVSVEHGKLLGLILVVPLYSILCFWFYRKPKYNLAEHFVIQSYTAGLLYVFTAIVFVPLFLLFPTKLGWNNWALQILFMIYMTITYTQLLRRNVFVIALKAILIKIVFVILFWGLIYLFVYSKHLIQGH